jgi:hypothetical protein
VVGLFSTEEQVRIKKDFGRATSLPTLQVNWDLIQALTSFWDPTLPCVSLGSVDLVPTIGEYAELLQVASSSTRIYMPIQRYRANKELVNTLRLRYKAMNPEVHKAGPTWRHANISFEFLARHWRLCQWRPGMGGAVGQGFHDLFCRYHLFSFLVGRVDFRVVPLMTSLSVDISIVPALVSETLRSFSYCRSHDVGVPMFCA